MQKCYLLSLFFSVAGVMHPKKVWVLFIQIYKFTIKCETRKKMRDHDFKEFHREYKKSFTWITQVGFLYMLKCNTQMCIKYINRV